MQKIKEWINTILIVISFIVLFVMLNNKKPDIINIEPKIIEAIEAETAKEKEIIKETKVQVVQIENSKEYLLLRKTLDSLMVSKDTSKFTTEVCYNTVITQDSIIDKQKIIINSQDKVIFNDSLVKLQYKEIIENKNIELAETKKKVKKSLWRGRAEGFVTGGVVGVVVGKVVL